MSEKRYMKLKVGDVIQDGDEWRYLEHPDFLQWTKCCNAGATILHDWVSEYRRPIAEPTVEETSRTSLILKAIREAFQADLVEQIQTDKAPYFGDVTTNYLDERLAEVLKPFEYHPVVKESSLTENGGEVGTPRTDVEEYEADVEARYHLTCPESVRGVVDANFARQLERELIATITRREELHKRLLKDANEIESLKKERDEWRDLAGKLHELLKTGCFGYAQYEVEVTSCTECGTEKVDEHKQGCSIGEALAAYELKAKEGV